MDRGEASCPRCSALLVARVGEVPWCAACEWHLGAYDRLTVPSQWGNRVLDRVAHWVAFRLDGYGFRRWVGRPVRREAGRVGRVLVLAVAALVAAFGPAALLGGVYLMVEGPGMTPFLGLVLALFAFAVRPRFVRGLPDGLWVVTRETAPTLFAMLERVAAAADAPMPDVVGFNARVNASAGRHGRRRVLSLGLPLWAALPAQQRIALVAHEFGHFVNHDARGHRLVATAYHTFGVLIGTLGAALWRTLGPVAFPVMLPLDAMYASLLVLGQRDGQRAEYLADQVASEVAGSDANAHLLDFTVVCDRLVPTLMAVHGRPGRPEAWRAAAEQALRTAGDLTALRQRSLRTEASLLAKHPPAGRRSRMVRGRPDRPPTVTMSDAEAQRIDAELVSCYDRLRALTAEAAYI